MSRNRYRGDRFTQRAHDEGFAARSVYKLDEIQTRFRLLRRGDRVVDLGCFPGSWSRLVLDVVGPDGSLVGVDLEAPTLSGGTFLARSVFDVTADELRDVLGGDADVVLSDMAPRTTGDSTGDHYRQLELARAALAVAEALVVPGGHFVCKVFDGPDANAFCDEVKAVFRKTKRVRPEAVRKNSREFFLVAQERRA